MTKNLLHLLSILFILLNTDTIHAQTIGKIFYKKTIDDKAILKPRTENFVIYFIGNKSVEFSQPKIIQESTVTAGKDTLVKTISLPAGNRKYFNYKDYDKNQLTLSAYIGFRLYRIEDTLSNFKWTITKEHSKILKYNCTKATTTFRGRKFIAWFTEDVPIQNGPWKFCGLPGLIVKVSDLENIYVYELEGLDFNSKFDLAIVTIPAAYHQDKSITHGRYIDLYAKKVEELEAQSRASAFFNSSGSGSSKSTIPPLIEKY